MNRREHRHGPVAARVALSAEDSAGRHRLTSLSDDDTDATRGPPVYVHRSVNWCPRVVSAVSEAHG
ncbi:MAG TPA: hypothetical protein VNT54_10655, partial [Solirubrobacteraceae bacterium]|nr:hypothetical protein [Solirubrobacteraceae bacterium]